MKNPIELLFIVAITAVGCRENSHKSDADARFYATTQQQIVVAENISDCKATRAALQTTLVNAEKQLPPDDTLLATLHHDIAAACINGCGTLDEAIAEGQRAFDIRLQKLGNAHILTARSGHLVAKAWNNKNELHRALTIYDQITAYRNPQNAQDSADLADIYSIISRIHYKLGDPEQAADFAHQSLDFFTDKGFPENRAFYFNALASAQSDNGKPDEALKTYQKALQSFAFADSIDPTHKDFWKSGTPSCWHNMGVTERESHHFDAAKSLLQKALTAFEQQKDSINAAETRIEQAKLFLETQQFHAAETAAFASLAARQRLLSPQHPDIVEAFTVLGDLRSAQSQPRAALDFYEKACRAIGDFRALEIVAPLMRRAELLAERTPQYKNGFQNLDSAFVACLVADSILTETRQIFQSDATKTDFAERTATFYETAVGVAAELYNQTKTPKYLDAAARFISRNKAQNWLDNFRDRRAKRFGNIPEADLRRERDLLSEIRFLEKTKADADSAQLGAWSNQMFKLKTDLSAVKKHFERDYPRYFDLKYSADEPLSISSLQNHLDDSTTVVEFYLGKNNLFTLNFDRRGARIFQQKLTPAFQTSFKNLRRALTDEVWLTDSTATAAAQFQTASYAVFNFLLKKPLDNCPATRRLRIVPDGRLGYVPFDALLEKPTAADWQEPSKMPYVLNHYAVSELFALRQISDDDRTPFPTSSGFPSSTVSAANFAGFGIEYADKNAVETSATIDETAANDALLYAARSGKMGRLRFATTEVKTIQQLLKTGRVWLNADAQKPVFIANAPHFDIIHLAMHGFSDDKQSLNSGLVFSKNAADTAANAEILRGYDILNLPLQARLAVLSACNTGDGEIRRGEGVMSLARAFSMAGCTSEIMSLWSIPDKTTSEIMTDFYANWRNGIPKDVALQRAKRAYLQRTTPQFTLPNYWAATVVIGDLSAIETPPMGSLLWDKWLAAAAIVLFTVLIFLKKKSPRKS